MTNQTVYHTEVFGDTIILESETFYYHPSLVKFAVTACDYLKTMDFSEIADKMRANFTQEARHASLKLQKPKKFLIIVLIIWAIY